MTTLSEQSAVPEFAHAVRGYDRYQVDDYIERLNEWAGGAQARAVEAEKRCQEQAQEIRMLRERLDELEGQSPAAPDRAIKVAADRCADAVAMAIQQADEIRRRAAQDAEHRLGEASRQAAAIVEAARQSVSGLSEDAARERREARQRVEAMLEEASRKADELTRRAAGETERAAAEARGEATRIVSEAEAAAAEIRARTEDERRKAGEAVQRLQKERAEIMAELNRLRGAIQTLISGARTATAPAPDAGGAEPTAVLEATTADSAPPDHERAGCGPDGRAEPGPEG